MTIDTRNQTFKRLMNTHWYNHGNVLNNAEGEFIEVAKRRGWEVSQVATLEQNKKEHWEYEITNGKLKYKVDAKGLKKINRSDTSYQDIKLWFEFTNGDGFPGWGKGKADLIALQRKSSFWIIRRKALLNYANFLVKHRNHHVKTRDGRQDEIILIDYDSVKPYLWNIW